MCYKSGVLQRCNPGILFRPSSLDPLIRTRGASNLGKKNDIESGPTMFSVGGEPNSAKMSPSLMSGLGGFLAFGGGALSPISPFGKTNCLMADTIVQAMGSSV